MKFDAVTEDAYESLVVSLEAMIGHLALHLAVCDDPALQRAIIDRYETELAPLPCYRLSLLRGDPSLTQAIRTQIQADPDLQVGGKAIFTIIGIETLEATQPVLTVDPRSFTRLPLPHHPLDAAGNVSPIAAKSTRFLPLVQSKPAL